MIVCCKRPILQQSRSPVFNTIAIIFPLTQDRTKVIILKKRVGEILFMQREADPGTTSFPGSLFSASLGRWKKDPGCGWSHDHPESGWQKNLLDGRGGRVLCLVDVKNFVGFKSSSSR